MKKVLVLGAGRIAGPCIQYLLAQDGYEVYVSDIDEANVRRCIGGKSNGHARIGNVMDDLPGTLREISPNAVVCLLPAAFMAQAAKACLEARQPSAASSRSARLTLSCISHSGSLVTK